MDKVERIRRVPCLLDRAWELVTILRGPDGCPWDRAQTSESIKMNLVEEAYEAVEAIEEGNDKKLKEELGDLLLVLLLHARIAEDEGRFTLQEVVDELLEKIIERHPHVFGERRFHTQEELLRNWESSKRDGVFGGLPTSLPALLLAEKIGKRAARVGFDWPRSEEVLEKLQEELKEFREVAQKDREKAEEEFGDILFTLVNYARHLGISPEEALRKTNRKFLRRFQAMEALAHARGKKLSELSLEELDRLWEEAKSAEKAQQASHSRGENPHEDPPGRT